MHDSRLRPDQNPAWGFCMEAFRSVALAACAVTGRGGGGRFLGALRDLGGGRPSTFLHSVALVGGSALGSVDMHAYSPAAAPAPAPARAAVHDNPDLVRPPSSGTQAQTLPHDAIGPKPSNWLTALQNAAELREARSGMDCRIQQHFRSASVCVVALCAACGYCMD